MKSDQYKPSGTVADTCVPEGLVTQEDVNMSYTLCEKVRELEPYEPISGTYRIRLDANESFFNLPEEVKDEIKDIIDKMDFNRYPDPMAKKLTKAFADYYGLDPENITVTNGSDEMLYLLASAMLDKESRVVVVNPDFSMYSFYSFLSENAIFSYQKNDKLNIDVDELISFAKENNADMLIFSNPCNPTGQGITAADAKKLVCSLDNCLVVLDEAYMDFWNEPVLKEAYKYDNLIVLKTASKAVGAAGIRLGFAVANPTITKALRAVKSPYNVNSLSQARGECIYLHKELLDSRRDEIIRNTRSLYDSIKKIVNNYKLPMTAYEPCTNFVFLETDKAKDIFSFMLENSVAVRFFKNAGALRITSGNEEENKEFLVLFEKYIIKKILKTNI